MELKFYLNKIIKLDNIEYYTLPSLIKLREIYDDFLSKSNGFDPDFPSLSFGGESNGEKIKGKNYYSLFNEEDLSEDDKGLLSGKLHI